MDILGDGDRVTIHERHVFGRIPHHFIEIDIHQNLALVQLKTAQLYLFGISVRLEAASQLNQFPQTFVADEFVIVGPQYFALDGNRFALQRNHDMVTLPYSNQFQIQVTAQKKAVKVHLIDNAITSVDLHCAQGTRGPGPTGVIDKIDDIGRAGHDSVVTRSLHLAEHKDRQLVQLAEADIHKRGALGRLHHVDERRIDLRQRPHDLRTQLPQRHAVGWDTPAALRQIDIPLFRNHQIQHFRQLTPDGYHDLITRGDQIGIINRTIGNDRGLPAQNVIAKAGFRRHCGQHGTAIQRINLGARQVWSHRSRGITAWLFLRDSILLFRGFSNGSRSRLSRCGCRLAPCPAGWNHRHGLNGCRC